MFLLMGVLWLASCVFSQDPLPLVYQLPASIIPLHYNLRLEPNMNTGMLTGAVLIAFNTTSNQSMPLSSVSMHLGTGIMPDESSVMLRDLVYGKLVQIGALIYDDTNTIFKLVMPDGNSLRYDSPYMFTVVYTTPFSPYGLLTGSINSTSNYFAFDFRPTYARNLFPCFDEPHFKVTIKLQVVRPADYIAVSTAPLETSSEPDSNNMVLDTFALTGPISIHSLGLFISQLTPVSTMGLMLLATEDVPTTVPQLDSLLSTIQDNLGPFPNDMKLVVLPDRLYTTYSSCGFVFTTPEIYTGVISNPMKWHSCKLELTEAFLRQYLEYQKTPQWWSHLWLSESLGAFLAMTFQPKPWNQDWIRNSIRSDAMGLDINDPRGSVVNDQPMSQWDIQDLISSKTVRNRGLSILTMWNDTMPEGLVIKTVNDFIKMPKSVVCTNDFLEIMVANILANTSYDVPSVIDELPAWFYNPGYPVVGWLQNTSEITLSQSSGCPSDMPLNMSMESQWPISISFTDASVHDWYNYRQDLWMNESFLNISIPTNSTQKNWTIVNLEAAPYCVHYNDMWDQILEFLPTDLGLNSDTPTSVRTSLQHDAVALSIAGCLSFSTTLNILVETQRDQLEWLQLVNALKTFIDKIGNDNNTSTQMQMYASILFPPELCYRMDLLNDTDPTSEQYARNLLTPWLCKFDLCNCRQAVALLFDQLLQGNISMIYPSDMENVACEGARYNSSQLDTLMAAYSNTSDLMLKYLYTIALSCVSDPQSVQTLLDTLLSTSSPFVLGDAQAILVGQASKLENSELITNFLVNRALEIQSGLGIGIMSNALDKMGEFNTDLSKLASLANESLGIHPYVIQKADRAMLAANLSLAWYYTTGEDLKAALPQIPTSSTASPATASQQTSLSPTASPTPPSSAKSLLDFRVFSLVATAAITAIAINL